MPDTAASIFLFARTFLSNLCHFSYLYPVKDLLITGHVLQEEFLQLLAQLLRRQDPFRQSYLRAGAVRQDELEFLFVSRRVDMMRKWKIKRW